MGAQNFIDNCEKIYEIKDDKTKVQLFKLDDKPTSGAIFCYPKAPGTDNYGHVAIVKDVKLVQKGANETEDKYEIVLLEQNGMIDINGKTYKSDESGGGKHSLVIGESKFNTKYNDKEGKEHIKTAFTLKELEEKGIKFVVSNN